MKTLLLIRHAKSSWKETELSDLDRPLNERGKRDAREMAKRLSEKRLDIDLYVSSPAKRAKSTAELFNRELPSTAREILLVSALYEAGPGDFFSVVSDLDDADSRVAIFSHNPGITDFVNTLTEMRLDNMPTCSVFAVSIPVDSWREFGAAQKKFMFFDYPKSTLHT